MTFRLVDSPRPRLRIYNHMYYVTMPDGKVVMYVPRTGRWRIKGRPNNRWYSSSGLAYVFAKLAADG